MRTAHTSSFKRRVRPLLMVALWSALVLVVAGCGVLTDSGESGDAPLTSGSEFAHVLSIDLGTGSHPTISEVEEEYGGQVFVWQPGEFALVGLNAAPQSGEPGYGESEPNEQLFGAGGQMATRSGESDLWAGGESDLWAGGESDLWAGGESDLWAGGSYLWMPQNQAIWDRLGLYQAHLLAPNLGRGVKIAVIDTGVDIDHPALKEALVDPSEWWDFYGDDRVPAEEGILGDGGYGHGTNVAGIVRQVAPRATILPIRVLGPDGRGDVADLAAGIDWAVEQGAQIVNLSLGAEHHVESVDKALLNAAKRGVFVFSSTGNSGDMNVTFPATSADIGRDAAYMVSVTSVDETDRKSEFATYHQKKVELASLGENVWGPAPENMMAAWSGTSMASPAAAGALALALGEVGSDSAWLLPEQMTSSATDIDAVNDLLHQGKLGDGRLDIEQFMKLVLGVTGSEGG